MRSNRPENEHSINSDSFVIQPKKCLPFCSWTVCLSSLCGKVFLSLRQRVWTSCWPVTNTSIPPSGNCLWILHVYNDQKQKQQYISAMLWLQNSAILNTCHSYFRGRTGQQTGINIHANPHYKWTSVSNHWRWHIPQQHTCISKDKENCTLWTKTCRKIWCDIWCWSCIPSIITIC